MRKKPKRSPHGSRYDTAADGGYAAVFNAESVDSSKSISKYMRKKCFELNNILNKKL